MSKRREALFFFFTCVSLIVVGIGSSAVLTNS